MILQNTNIEIITAFNGAAGIELALTQNPDVIITDLMMPRVSGFALMKQVLAQSPDLPIIVVTAYSSMDAAVRALKLGAVDFLIKPITAQAIEDAVGKASRQQLRQKFETWQQLITSTLNTFQAADQIAPQLLLLTATALDAEHGLLLSEPSSTNNTICLNPGDAALEPTLRQWAADVALAHTIFDNSTGHVATSVTLEGPPPFSGSVVSISLPTHHSHYATLILAHRQHDYFDEYDVAFLENLATLAALSLDKASTYSRLQASNTRLSTLHSINNLTYSAKLPLNRILRLAVEGIRQNIGYPMVVLCLPETRTSTALVVRAAAGWLDRFLQRRGDTPTRHLVFPTHKEANNPITLAFQQKKVQDASAEVWRETWQEIQAPDIAAEFPRHNIVHGLAIPLWQSDRIIGVLAVGCTKAHLPPEERTMLTTLANQIALVVANASLYQAEQQRRKEMEALYQAGLVIASSISQADVLKAIAEQIVTLAVVEGCIIGRWNQREDAETVALYLQETSTGWVEEIPAHTTFPLSERAFVKAVLQTQELKIVRWDDPKLHASEKMWMEQINARLRLIIPLTIRGHSTGVIELVTADDTRVFNKHTIRLMQGLAAQAAIAMENARLHEAETRRLEREMELAQHIQVSLLPNAPPPIPGLSIAARSVAARQVGGDFYRYLSLPNNKFCVVIGDVSGKGVPAALFMAITITALDSQIKQQSSATNILFGLNTVLYARMQANRMNTGLLVALFDMESRTVEFANAGMIAPLVQGNNNYTWLDVYGLPLGAVPEATYQSRSISLDDNTTIILSSDGIVEAQNETGALFGFERMQQSTQTLPTNATSQQILEHLWRDTSNHMRGVDPHDDMTLIVIQANNTH